MEDQKLLAALVVQVAHIFGNPSHHVVEACACLGGDGVDGTTVQAGGAEQEMMPQAEDTVDRNDPPQCAVLHYAEENSFPSQASPSPSAVPSRI